MSDTRVIATCCSVCEHACGMQVTVRGNEVLEIAGLKEHPLSRGYLCPKGRAADAIRTAPDRLRAPLKRYGDVWKEISWDEALDLCAQGLGLVRDRFGPEGIVAYHGQSYLKNRLSMFLMKRFLNLYGVSNLSSAGSECFVSTLLAHFATFGNLPFPDYARSGCIMLWGANPCASGCIGMSFPQVIDLLNSRKAQGAQLIVIDPRRTRAAEMADVHLQPRPGTDGALALGFIRAVLDAGLEDRGYIESHTDGFDRLQELVAEYPVQRAADITGIEAQVIRDTACLFASTKPACLKAGSGLEHHTNGVQAIRATNVLLAITGNIDVPGGNTFLAQAMLAMPEVDYSERPPRLGAEEHPVFVGMVNQAHAVAMLEHLVRDEPYKVRGMIVAGGAPLTVLAGAGKASRVMDRMEFSVVIDHFMTETARHARLVLPAATFLERDELIINPLALQRRCVEPDGPWPDWKIWWELAGRCGFVEHFPWKSPHDVMRHMLEPTDYTFEQLQAAPGGILIEQEVGKLLREGLYTASGKIELYSSSLESSGYDPLPGYHEPAESPISAPDTAEEYPLILTTGGRYETYVHSQHRSIKALNVKYPEALLELHPDTAFQCGVADGAWVLVESPRGSIRLRALVTGGIRPGVVHAGHGWEAANCNLLTDDMARDPISGFPALKSSLCRVRPLNTERQ